jgi:ATP-dependent Clp protease ATP-binding subunit ClpA
MFERFTAATRQVVIGAQDQARRLDHRAITTPHLLLSLVESDAGELLRAHGVTAQAVRDDLADLVGRHPRAAEDDAAVLAALGIDMARIRAAVEANFGPGALDRPITAPAEEGRGLLDRLRLLRGGAKPREGELETLRSPGTPRGHIPFTAAAKKVLELSLRESLRLGDDHIGAEHLTLGLLRASDGVAAVVLDRLGTDVAAVRRDAEERLQLRRSA